jgi:putative tRNA adenosine deaminase-associated protein
MSSFATLLVRADGRWRGEEVDVDDCESVADIADLAIDATGDVRLILIEQDDEYAAIVRVDDDVDDARAFLSDGHAADNYPLAAAIAEDLGEIGDADSADESDDDVSEDDADLEPPPAHDSAPFGDADIVEDLGTSAAELLAMCAHEGTLPIDVLVAVCEKAGCADMFDELRA